MKRHVLDLQLTFLFRAYEIKQNLNKQHQHDLNLPQLHLWWGNWFVTWQLYLSLTIFFDIFNDRTCIFHYLWHFHLWSLKFGRLIFNFNGFYTKLKISSNIHGVSAVLARNSGQIWFINAVRTFNFFWTHVICIL